MDLEYRTEQFRKKLAEFNVAPAAIQQLAEWFEDQVMAIYLDGHAEGSYGENI